jgi:4'-phosphopantetheinyl transferase EntD
LRVVELDDHLTVPASALAFVAFADRDGAEASAVPDWLAPAEAMYARGLASARRRAAWLAGRLAAKAALARLVSRVVRPDRIEVLPAAGGGPVVRIGGEQAAGPLEVSISHTRHLAAAVAYDRRRSGAVGIDVEVCDQTIDPALLDTFTDEERRAILACDDSARHLCTLWFWTAKEAALKAVRQGLRLPLTAVRLAWTEGHPPVGALVQCAPDISVPFDLRWIACPGHVVAMAVEAAHEG